ncbi:MAG: antitoxin family protein [Planctomycetales bacterium]|nr:antitoxin family protein [Planctomycetales bacterium]MCA9208859.1 antitoxin family protein [Planctomycetales bacterium]MCA9219879.1 antitoxin family protein [Planctomycetales bacterium]
MKQIIEAVYENGMFRPLMAVPESISDGQQVRLEIEATNRPSPNNLPDVLNLAGQVYDGLTNEDIDDIERIALDRSSFFDRRN